MTIWIVAEALSPKSVFTTIEALTPAQTLASQSGSALCGVVLADSEAAGRTVADALAVHGFAQVIVGVSPRLATYQPQVYAAALAKLIESRQPKVVLVAATSTGSDYAPRVAYKTSAGLITQAQNLAWDNGALTATKAGVAESLIMSMHSAAGKTVIVTVRPKTFEAPAANAVAASVEIVNLSLDSVASGTEFVSVTAEAATRIKLEEADVVVSGGRGLQAPENFALVEQLAEALGGAVGATRAVVDAGWRPHSEQVGQTGKTVSPKLYVALGISGAIQHLVGMRTSRTLVAINRDADAPLMKQADVAVVGDALTLVPKLIAKLKG
ncbi:MAG: electron transfer flavoprotein subunit alpha/FixB family protein [Vampirovibrionales bacterium]|nr:electron transfer flavoprotein subunit alpha/FixB family protein [Vampirovibrionales bacterium]